MWKCLSMHAKTDYPMFSERQVWGTGAILKCYNLSDPTRCFVVCLFICTSKPKRTDVENYWMHQCSDILSKHALHLVILKHHYFGALNLLDVQDIFLCFQSILAILKRMVSHVPCTPNKNRTLHRHTKSWTNTFDTDLWCETGEFAEAAGSCSEDCKTKAVTTETPRSIIKTVNVRDMVDEPDDQSIDQLVWSQTRGARRLQLVLCVWLDKEIGVTRQWCCTRYCLSGPGKPGFLSSCTASVSLRYLTLLSCPCELVRGGWSSREKDYRLKTNRQEWDKGGR